MEADEVEEPLPGGDVTAGVVRVGQTVRRPTGPHTATVHRVLQHLEAHGFSGAPRLHGLDDQGREVLSFVPGEVAGRPWPAWVADEARAVSVARLTRRLDDCLLSLGLPAQLVPAANRAVEESMPGPPPTFLGHRDLTPENTVFREGRAAAFIDFDLVQPSRRVDEVVNLLLWWGAWMPPDDREPAMRAVDPLDRGRVLVDAYGLEAADRVLVVPVAIATAHRSWHVMRERAETLGGGWARMWQDGVGDRIRRRQGWLREHRAALHDAVTAG